MLESADELRIVHQIVVDRLDAPARPALLRSVDDPERPSTMRSIRR
jgi:hypothetical protein